MSETEYMRLAEKLDAIRSDVSQIRTDTDVISTRLSNYDKNCQILLEHDKKIDLIQERCHQVQELKKIKQVNWGAVVGYIIGALAVALIVKFLPI